MAGNKVKKMCELVTSMQQSSWKATANLYKDALTAKANKLRPEKKKQLIELDAWFQNNLPEAICSRKEKHITHEELCKLMTWKLTRGKFRPRLSELVKVNLESEVEEASKKAFKKLPNLQNAIKELIVLKAVGPATASAVLAAGAPNHAAFMADESMLAIGGLQPIKYDLPFYMNYMGEIKSLVKQLNEQDSEKSWTPHKVELVLWTYQILQTLAPEKLKKIKTVSENGDGVRTVGKKDKVLKESKGDNAGEKESEPPKKKKRKT